MTRHRGARAWVVAGGVAALVSAWGCGSLPPEEVGPVGAPEGSPPPRLAGHIIAAERGRIGARLVLVDESGARLADITDSGAVAVRDSNPSWSPDGRWVVFASSRGRDSMASTSLWIVEAVPGAQPRRVTSDEAVDRDPVWMADGRAVVFSSNRAGSFDLWRLEVSFTKYGAPVAAGTPVRLTSDPGQELGPAPSPDGKRIAYARLEPDNTMRLWIWTEHGSTPLTAGPADTTPAWSPDGETIAFAAPASAPRAQVGDVDTDLDIYAVHPDGSGRRAIAREPLADQLGPVWSTDGRYLFATSVFRSVPSRKPVLASIVFIDMRQPAHGWRALHDPVVVESRTGVAIEPAQLDEALLRGNPPYQEALRRAVEEEIIRAIEQQRIRSTNDPPDADSDSP